MAKSAIDRPPTNLVEDAANETPQTEAVPTAEQPAPTLRFPDASTLKAADVDDAILALDGTARTSRTGKMQVAQATLTLVSAYMAREDGRKCPGISGAIGHSTGTTNRSIAVPIALGWERSAVNRKQLAEGIRESRKG